MLNIITFESLIATNASKLRLGGDISGLSKFGRLKGHSTGAINAARAAVIEGNTGMDEFRRNEHGL